MFQSTCHQIPGVNGYPGFVPRPVDRGSRELCTVLHLRRGLSVPIHHESGGRTPGQAEVSEDPSVHDGQCRTCRKDYADVKL